MRASAPQEAPGKGHGAASGVTPLVPPGQPANCVAHLPLTGRMPAGIELTHGAIHSSAKRINPIGRRLLGCP